MFFVKPSALFFGSDDFNRVFQRRFLVGRADGDRPAALQGEAGDVNGVAEGVLGNPALRRAVAIAAVAVLFSALPSFVFLP